MDGQHDQAFLQILCEEKNIINFMNAFFGFLCRCTDFYVEFNVEQKLGFPPGVTEKLVIDLFHKWKIINERVPLLSDSLGSTSPLPVIEESPAACIDHEVEIETNDDEPIKNLVPLEQLSDSYNGAIRDNYTWSQTITDLDVIVKIPECVQTGKKLKVNITADEIKITVKRSILCDCNPPGARNYVKLEDYAIRGWTPLLEGRFCQKIRKDESIWSFVPGQHITIHLEKTVERWWDALLEGEPKLELAKLDCSRNLDELGAAEQMKIEELMWNHQQKLLQKPTSEQLKMEGLLKKAWNVEGSPFKGTKYDPSVLKLD